MVLDFRRQVFSLCELVSGVSVQCVCVCLRVREWGAEGGSGADVCCHVSGFLNRAVSFLEADENQRMVGNKLVCVRETEESGVIEDLGGLTNSLNT